MSKVPFKGDIRTLALALASLIVVMFATRCATSEPPPSPPGKPVTTDGKPVPPEAFNLPRHSINLRSARSGKPTLEKTQAGGSQSESSR